ncbi:hypothetical protein [Methylomonas sp. MgM2]
MSKSHKTNEYYDEEHFSQILPVIGYDLPPSNKAEAKYWVDHAINLGKAIKENHHEIRRVIFFLVYFEVYKKLGLDELELFEKIRRKSGLNKSTIYDYMNAAIVEVELDITQGVMSVDALTYLYHHTEEDERKDIFELGMETKKVAEEINKSSNKKKKKRSRNTKSNEYLTKKQVVEAIEQYNKHDGELRISIDDSDQKKHRPKGNTAKLNKEEAYDTSIYETPLVITSTKDKSTKDLGTKRERPSQLIEAKKDKLFHLSIVRMKAALKILEHPKTEGKIAYFLLRKLDKEEISKIITALKKEVRSQS